MYEDRSLRSYTDEELGEDPLVVLSCGHVFPMSSMDGHLELERVYGHLDVVSRDGTSTRIWNEPKHLQVHSIFSSITVFNCSQTLHTVLDSI